MTLKVKLFSFEGRLRRRDWWLLGIGLALLNTLIAQLIVLLILGPDQSFLTSGAVWLTLPDFKAQLIAIIMGLLFLWPQLALATKRAHDRNKSARLVVALIIATFSLSFIPHSMNPALTLPTTLGHALASSAFNAFTMGASVYILVVLGFLDGTRGPNRFGPAPKMIKSDGA